VFEKTLNNYCHDLIYTIRLFLTIASDKNQSKYLTPELAGDFTPRKHLRDEKTSIRKPSLSVQPSHLSKCSPGL